MNFLKNLRSKETVEEPMNASNDMAFGEKGADPVATTVLNVDKMHLYGDLVGNNAANNASSSFGPY